MDVLAQGTNSPKPPPKIGGPHGNVVVFPINARSWSDPAKRGLIIGSPIFDPPLVSIRLDEISTRSLIVTCPSDEDGRINPLRIARERER
jgi:hypothetical protein